MKILNINGEQFKAEKIIKTDNNIIGEDLNGNEIFAFKGISDFTQFSFEDGQTFDTEGPSEQDILNAQLLKENADMKAQLTEQQELTSQLLLEIATLKGGNTSV